MFLFLSYLIELKKLQIQNEEKPKHLHSNSLFPNAITCTKKDLHH